MDSNIEEIKLNFDTIYNSNNVAELLDDTELNAISRKVIDEFEDDSASREDWERQFKQILKIAKQTQEAKTFPWQGAANVKMPLITTASLQYAARSYPEVVKDGRVVQTALIGIDQTGEKETKAKRVTQHMNYQLLVESKDWEVSLDSLLHVLPIYGMVYKKVWYDPIRLRNVSELCLPDKIVVSNEVQSLDAARRITHVIPSCLNDVIEAIRHDLYLDVEEDLRNTGNNSSDTKDYDHPLELLEQHRYLDLDGDGYEEPYIVTVERTSEKVLRIVRCFDMDDVAFTLDGGIKRIKRTQYFIPFHFIPSPDGSYHSIGFGQLLLPLNETVNTLMNQLLDAGTLANMRGGFLGRAFRNRKGEIKMSPGKWIYADSGGEDLQKSIVPMPVAEPSQVLFQMMGVLLQQSKDLASVTDMLQGQQQAQNVPATTALSLIEQGLKVFNSLQKRLYRSLKDEFTALFRLNSKFLDPKIYFRINGSENEVLAQDYSVNALDIQPVADPTMSSEASRMAKAQAVLALMPSLPPGGALEAQKMYLNAIGVPQAQIDLLLPKPDPNAPPSPEILKLMAETKILELQPYADQVRLENEQKELALKEMEKQIRLMEMETNRIIAQANATRAEAESIAALAKVDNDKLLKSAELLVSALYSKQTEQGLNKNHIRGLIDALGFDKVISIDDIEERAKDVGQGNIDQGGLPPMEEQPGNAMAIPGNPMENAGLPRDPNIGGGIGQS